MPTIILIEKIDHDAISKKLLPYFRLPDTDCVAFDCFPEKIMKEEYIKEIKIDSEGRNNMDTEKILILFKLSRIENKLGILC